MAVRDRASVIVGTAAPSRAAAQLVFLLALSVSLWRLTLPNALTGAGGYDDGVYMAAAARLVQGHLPYRDFTFLHPPGLPMLLSPVGALGELLGTRHAFAVARVLTAVVGAANAALIGYALRARGVGAVLVAGLAFAVWPLAVSGSGTLTLEPYVLLFALIGTCLLFSTRQRASPTRLVWAGAAFGFACSVKLSGALVVLAAGLVCLVFARRALPRLAVGFGLGIGLICLPFLAAAPSSFVHDVILVQLQRGIEVRYALPVADRLLDIFGLSATLNPDSRWALMTLAVLVALIVVCVALNRGRLLPVEWFALSASALTAAAVLRAPQFYTYYAYYPSAFACLVLGLLFATYGRFALARVLARSRPGGILLRSAAYAALAGAVLLVLPVTTRYSRGYLAQDFDPRPTIQQATVTAGSCVVFDNPALAIAADRLSGGGRDCPPLVDPFGAWLAQDPEHPPPTSANPAFTRTWKDWLSRSDVLLLSVPQSSFIPWTPDLLAWFDVRFTPAENSSHVFVYQRTPRATVTPAQLLQRGLAAQNAGHWFLAADDYQELERRDPSNPVAPFNLGVLAAQRGMSEEAEDAYRRALHRDPKFTPALFNLAVAATSRDPALAIVLYGQVLAIRPDDAGTKLNLGILLYEHGQQREARQLLEEAVELEPSFRNRLPAGAGATSR